MSGNIPYIGSKISLITTSDIRYEGILYTLNREESTIAVQNVRSFGTEGRRCPEVPMSNEIYDFIIFRGKDLKDLTVLQGAPEPAPPVPYTAGGGSEFLDNHGSSLYNQPPPEQSVNANMGAFQRPGQSLGSTAAARNGGFPPSAQTGNMPTNPYASAPSPYPASSASRTVQDRTFGGISGGVPPSQTYASREMQGTSMSSPPPRGLYEDSNGAAKQRIPSSYDDAKLADEDQSKDRSTGLGLGAGKGAGPGASFDDSQDAKARGKGAKGGNQKKSLFEVLRFHQRAEVLIVKMMRGQNSANIGPGELRAMSEMNPAVYHFYLDFVNYCCPPHTVQSDEQQWEMLCKALKKHFEKELGFVGASNQQNQKPPAPVRPNNTLGDFITIQEAKGKKNMKPARGGGRGLGAGAGRGATGRGDKKELGHGSEWDTPDIDESPGQPSHWACPRCTLRNENLLLSVQPVARPSSRQPCGMNFLRWVSHLMNHTA